MENKLTYPTELVSQKIEDLERKCREFDADNTEKFKKIKIIKKIIFTRINVWDYKCQV